MTFTPSDFDIELENYRTGLQEILPAYLDGVYHDEAFIDELALVLQSRDWLESAMAVTPRYARESLSKIEALDQRLLSLKDKLLKQATFYVRFREQAPRPRSHWWYYLDKIITQPQPHTSNSKVEFWLPLAG